MTARTSPKEGSRTPDFYSATELVTERQRGLGALETARAETAALRSLANAGRLLDDHPALARQRLVQAAPMGSQVVLRLGADERGVEKQESTED